VAHCIAEATRGNGAVNKEGWEQSSKHSYCFTGDGINEDAAMIGAPSNRLDSFVLVVWHIKQGGLT